ncbi:Protein phosphatase 1F [Chionoecetes opilio]|uniref:Protein phosphatase 1F n=1 Tax=Chionoecetes opilio TaxID=41210 RepID=A0A8J4XM59_CHIOP|nr:Protein phosphatase 1F [Chionoecetes opilio]
MLSLCALLNLCRHAWTAGRQVFPPAPPPGRSQNPVAGEMSPCMPTDFRLPENIIPQGASPFPPTPWLGLSSEDGTPHRGGRSVILAKLWTLPGVGAVWCSEMELCPKSFTCDLSSILKGQRARVTGHLIPRSEEEGRIHMSRECPPYVREYVSHQVWMAIRNTELNGDGFDHVDTANTTNHTYDIMKLIQEVTGKANTVIQEMQSTLTGDQVEKLPRYHPISHFAIKNGRRKMEDRHVIINDLSTLYGLHFKQPHAYYGVFDGHAGIDAAVYSAAHLHQYMIQNPQYETNPEAALKHAFHITDTNFIKKASKEVVDQSDCGASVGNTKITDLVFADDSIIFAESLEVLVMALEALHEEAKPLGLEVSWLKTKV